MAHLALTDKMAHLAKMEHLVLTEQTDLMAHLVVMALMAHLDRMV
jgi:hypothetical protein